jgi:hypothetical protein
MARLKRGYEGHARMDEEKKYSAKQLSRRRNERVSATAVIISSTSAVT